MNKLRIQPFIKRIVNERVKPLYTKIQALLLRCFSKTHRELSFLPDALSAFSEKLQSESSRVDSDFLRLSRDLQATHSDAMAIVKSALDTVTLMNEDDGVGINQLDRAVQSDLEQLRSVRNSVYLDVACFAKGAALMENLYDLTGKMDKMSLSLRTVGLNIGVESSRYTKAQELFGMVASEVKTLSIQMAQISDTIRGAARQAEDLQNEAHRRFSESISELNHVSAEAEETVADATEKIKKITEFSLSAMNQAGEDSREISHQVSNLVEGIQFHDNMHQRITHINEALQEASNNCRFTNSSIFSIDGKDGRESDLPHAQEIVALQVDQLKQVIEDVNQSHKKSSHAFDAINTQVANLVQTLSVFNPEETSNGALTSPVSQNHYFTSDPAGSAHTMANTRHVFSQLNRAVERFNGLLEQGQTLHESMEEIFVQAASSARGLTDSLVEVRQINFKVHILALNAIVKANHMGQEGQVLEVMAQAMKDISAQSNHFVIEVDTLLEEIVGVANARQSGNTSIKKESNSKEETTLKNISIDIMAVYKKLNRESTDVVRRARALMQALAEYGSGLGFFNELKAGLSLRLEELEGFESLLGPWAYLPEENSITATDKLKANYTMAQERFVHDNRSAVAKDFDLTEGHEYPEEGCELFDALPPLSGSGSEDHKNEDDLGENIELF